MEEIIKDNLATTIFGVLFIAGLIAILIKIYFYRKNNGKK